MDNTHHDGVDVFIPETGVVDNIYQIQGVGEFDEPNIIAAGNEFSTTAIHIQNDNEPASNIEESIFYYWFDASNQEPLTGFGYTKRETELQNECEEDYCSPCILEEDIADEKERFHIAIAARDLAYDDYINAIEEEELETAEENRLEMAANTVKAFKASYNLVQYFWRDTTAFNEDTLLAWYAKMNYYASDILAAGEIAKMHGYSSAIDFLEDIPLNRVLLPEEEVDLVKIIDIFSLLDTTGVYDLTVSQRNSIRGIAQTSKGSSSVMARSILSFYGEYFPLTYYLNEVTRPAVAYRSTDTTAITIKHDIGLQVMPNPADDEIVIRWDLNPSKSASHLILTDYLGRNLNKTTLDEYQTQVEIDVSAFSAGLYIATLVLSDAKIYSTKFIIK